MHHKNCCGDQRKGSKPEPIATERNRFFTGKYMTARDFRADPDYLLSRHRLQNRLVLGWGIACGLEVTAHPQEGCCDWLHISQGIAVDCYGREIILPDDASFRISFPEDPNYPDLVGLHDIDEAALEEPMAGEADWVRRYEGHEVDDADEELPGKPYQIEYLLCVRYCERPVEMVPALYSDGSCDPQQDEYNRIRETPEFRQIPIDMLGKTCWHTETMECPEQSAPPDAIDDPSSPCNEWVPLALVTLFRTSDTSGKHKTLRFKVDLQGRREMHFPGRDLTRIIGINWEHAGEEQTFVNEQEFRVRFSRPLKDDCINESTFIVLYHDLSDSTPQLTRYQPWLLKAKPPHRDPDNPCFAVFPLHDEFADLLKDKMVTIQLLGDFLVDCHDSPPDVTFIGGTTPTGNGIAGGTFHSWLTVKKYESGDQA